MELKTIVILVGILAALVFIVANLLKKKKDPSKGLEKAKTSISNVTSLAETLSQSVDNVMSMVSDTEVKTPVKKGRKKTTKKQ